MKTKADRVAVISRTIIDLQKKLVLCLEEQVGNTTDPTMRVYYEDYLKSERLVLDFLNINRGQQFRRLKLIKSKGFTGKIDLNYRGELLDSVRKKRSAKLD